MASETSEFGYVMCATMCVLRSTAVRLRNFDVVFAPLCSLFVPYSYTVIVANGCTLVALENRIEVIPGVRFLFLPLLSTPPLNREYNAVSAVADEVWQYRMGGNLTGI